VGTITYFATAALDARRGRLFIAGGNALTVFDTRRAVVTRTFTLDDQIGSVAVDAGTGLVYGLSSSAVDVLDPKSGQIVRAIDVEANPAALALDGRRGRLLVAIGGETAADGTPLGDGSLEILDGTTGTLLRRVDVGVAPSAVTVNDASGQVAVVNSGGSVQTHDAWGWVPAWLRAKLPFLAPNRQVHTEPGSVTIIDTDR
jgi:DNA-binding beta-propeller fold protein YncE